MKPLEIEYLIKNGTRATLEKISADLLKVGSDGSQSGDAISAAFLRTEAQASLLRDFISRLETKLLELQSANPDIDQTTNIAEAEKLKTKIEELKTQLVQLEQTGENTQVLPQSLPNAKRQFDGLHFSIQQMAREMPSLAMGPQMFFLAISNNLPIFTDELARAKKEYAELIATGQKGTPVWKQVVKSLFSWQTALTTGIMFLVMYGDEIVKSISDMTGWGAAKRKMREELEKSIESEKEAIKSTAKTRFELEQTIKSIKNFTGTKNEERQKIDELNSKYGESFGYYQTLSGWYDTLISKSEAYSNMLILQTKNQGLANDFIEAEAKVKEIEMTPEGDVDGSMGWFQRGLMYNAQGQSHGTFDAQAAIDEHDKQNKADKLAEAKAEVTKIKEQMIANEESVAAIIKGNNLNEVVTDSVEDLQNSISIRRNALIKITDPTEYKKQLAEIEKLETEVRKITGAKAPGAGDADNKAKSYDRDRLSSIKEARGLELELERSATDDKLKLIEIERKARVEAIEAEKVAYIKEHGEKADVSGFDRQIAAVNKQAEFNTKVVKSKDKKDQQKAFDSVLETIESYERERTRIVEEYAAKRKMLYEDEGQTILKKGATQGDVDWLNNAEAADLTSLDLSTAQASSKIKAIWDNTTNIASEALDKIIADAEELYNVLSTQGVEYTPEIGEQFGLTREQFEALLDKIPELRERIDQLRAQSDKTKASFEGLSGAWKQMIKGAKDGDLNVFKQGLDGINDKVGSAITLANGLADTLASIGDATGNDTWNSIAEGIGQVTSALSETLSMAQAGSAFGPVGAAIGAVIGLASSIAGMFAAAAETRRETARLNDELIQQEPTAQYEINQLYRERYDWAKKIAETELENAKRNILEAEKQLDANKNEQSELLSMLQGEKYITGYHTKKTGLFGWGKGKTVEDHSSLSGKSYDEILEIEAEGKLTPEAQAYLDQLKELYNEEGELAQRLEDARVAQQEAWAGLSLDDAVNAAMDDLLDGTISAGDAYDKIMQGAAKNMLKELMNKDIKEWYEGFAVAGEDGYTAEEEAYWKKKYEDMQAENERRKEDVERTTGVDLDSSTTQTGRSGSFETMTQDQGTKLEGLFTASEMRIARIEDGVESVSTQMNTAVNHLAQIETNTGASAISLKNLVAKVEQIIRDGLNFK